MIIRHLVIFLVAQSWISARCDADTTPGSFLWLSDIHLDPFYGRAEAVQHKNSDYCTLDSALQSHPYGQAGCDSPLVLVQAALTEAAAQTVRPDFVVISGDFCRHGNDRLADPLMDTEDILSNLSATIQSTFAALSIVPNLGNNDVTPDYYLDLEETANNTLLAMVTAGLAPLLASNEERSTFSKGGYLARNVTETITVLSLNTLMYSTNHQPDQSYLQDPLGQFKWLETQLELLASSSSTTKRVVYIIGHIPPALGSFRHTQLWHEHYLDRYFSILASYPESIIAGQLFGHLHSDEFRLVEPTMSTNTNASRSFPLFLGSSITPIFGANPSWRVVEYESDTGHILDYTSYYMDLNENNASDQPASSSSPTWIRTLSFRESFEVADLSSASLRRILSDLTMGDDNSTVWESLLSRQRVYAAEMSPCAVQCRLEWICTIQSTTTREYNMCLAAGGTSASYWQSLSSFQIVLIVAGFFVVTIGVMAWMATMRRNKRGLYQPQHQGQDDPNDGTTDGNIGLYQDSGENGGSHKVEPPEIS